LETTVEVSTNIIVDTSDGDLRGAEATTPVAKVFNTPELLEGVLSHLPVLDLVIATGVNKTFRNTIQASVHLQRHLFLLPTNREPEYWKLVRRDTNGVFRPVDDHEANDEWDITIVHLSLPDVSLGYHLVPIASDTDGSAPSRRSLQAVSLCPLLSPLQRHYRLATSTKSVHIGVKFDAKAITTGGPWSHMFLSNPPSKTVQYHLTWQGHVDDTSIAEFHVHRGFHCEEGVTFANLADDAFHSLGMVTVRNSGRGRQYLNTTTARGRTSGAGYVAMIDDTTVQEQITDFLNLYNGVIVQLKADEYNVDILSSYAPTVEEYEEMSALGCVRTTVL
jgi:hypothetical protein